MCHKRWTRPASPPGAPVPPDNTDSIFLSPGTSLARSAVGTLLPAGTPITLPDDTPAPRPIFVTGIEHAIATFTPHDVPLSARDLGRLRVELLWQLSRLPDNDDELDSDVAQGIAQTALLAWQTVGTLAFTSSTLLWNEELDPSTFVARTILLADHVLTPDRLVAAMDRVRSNSDVRALARSELHHEPLIRSGRLISVPSGTALTLGRESVRATTLADLKNTAVTGFIRDQLVIEGPTAREVLLINAKDDLAHAPFMWLFAHIDHERVTEDRIVTTRMLGQYDPEHNYRPWIEQTTRDAIRNYVQRTAERMVVADLVGAEYVAASPFEARIMQRREPNFAPGPASASIWADVPTLRDLTSRDLSRILDEDEAVEDLRARVRLAMGSAPDLAGRTKAIQELTAEIEHASTGLERKMRTERAYSAVAPAVLGGAGLVLGSAGGLPGLAGAALATVAGIVPWIGSRRSNRRDAAYIFVTARRRRR